MCRQDGAYAAQVASHNRRLMMMQQPQQQRQPMHAATAAGLPIAVATVMLLVAAVLCMHWRRRAGQQQQPHAQHSVPQQHAQQCMVVQHTPRLEKPQQAWYSYSCDSSSSSGLCQQHQQQLQVEATQSGLAAAAQRLIKQLLLSDQRRSSSSSSRGYGRSSAPTAASSTAAATAADAAKNTCTQMSVVPMGSEAYHNSAPARCSCSMQRGMFCRGSDSSSGSSDSASSIDAAMCASKGNPEIHAAGAATSTAVAGNYSAAAAPSVAASSSSADSLGPPTTMLTEANLLRCVAPHHDSRRYNNQVIFIPDSQPTSPAATAAAAAAAAALSAADAVFGATSPGNLLRQLHSSTASSNNGSLPLRGVNAALSGLQTCEEDAHGLPAVVIGTLTRAQAAAIKFGRVFGCNSYSRVFRAKLGQQDIAVRVVNHSDTSLEQVSEMLHDVLSLQHPHVLKAHAYVTWAAPCAPESPAFTHQAGSSSCSGVSNKDSAYRMPVTPSRCCSPPAAAGDASMQQQQQLAEAATCSPDSLEHLPLPDAAPESVRLGLCSPDSLRLSLSPDSLSCRSGPDSLAYRPGPDSLVSSLALDKHPASLNLHLSPGAGDTGPGSCLLLSPGCAGQQAGSSSMCSPGVQSSAAARDAVVGACMGGTDDQPAAAAASDGVRRMLGANQLETWVVEEYCHAGSLQLAVQRGGMQRFQENGIPQMAHLLAQLLGVARAMEYLHSVNMVVGDVRASNILLTYAPQQTAAATIATAAAACVSLGAASFSSAPSGFSPHVPAGVMWQQQQQHEGSSLVRAGSLPCSPRALSSPALQRTGYLNLGQQQQQRQHGVFRDDSAGIVTMRLVPKVAELGIGRVINEGATHLSTHTLGAVNVQAPEVMKTGVLSRQADVYAFGMLMWEVIMGCEPWNDKCMGDIINLVLVDQARPQFAATVPKGYARLAASCWQEVPQVRPTFEQLVLLLEHMKADAQCLQIEVNAACGSYLGYFS